MTRLVILMLVFANSIFAEEIELPKGISFRHISENLHSDFTMEHRWQKTVGKVTEVKFIYLQNAPMPITGIKLVNYTRNETDGEKVEIVLTEVGKKYITSVGVTPLILALIYEDQIISLAHSTESGTSKDTLSFAGPFDYQIETDPWKSPSKINQVTPRPIAKPESNRQAEPNSPSLFERLFRERPIDSTRPAKEF